MVGFAIAHEHLHLSEADQGGLVHFFGMGAVRQPGQRRVQVVLRPRQHLQAQLVAVGTGAPSQGQTTGGIQGGVDLTDAE